MGSGILGGRLAGRGVAWATLKVCGALTLSAKLAAAGSGL